MRTRFISQSFFLVASFCVLVTPLRVHALFFGDAEAEHANALHAATATLAVEVLDHFDGVLFSQQEERIARFAVTNTGSLPLHIMITMNGAPQSACAALSVVAERDGAFGGSGTMDSFSLVDPVPLPSGATRIWTLRSRVLDNARTAGETCNITGSLYGAQSIHSGMLRGFTTEVVRSFGAGTLPMTRLPDTPTLFGWNVPGRSTTRAQTPPAFSCGSGWTNDASLAGTWSDESVSGAEEYVWELTTPSGHVVTNVTTDTAMEYYDTSGEEGAWSLRVRAQDASGTRQSAWSSPCTIMTDYTAPTPDFVAWGLTAPTQTLPLVVTQLGSNAIAFDWETDELSTTAFFYDPNPADPYDFATYRTMTPSPRDTYADHTAHHIVAVMSAPGDYFYGIILTDRAGNTWQSPEPMIINLPALSESSMVTLNEIMADPQGHDDALMPGGEWVELYNRGGTAINLNGWKIREASGGTWTIRASNSDTNGDTADGGETVIPAGGYLVVYRNAASAALNNDRDEVQLIDSAGIQRDMHIYDNTGQPEGKTTARFPNGVGIWIDPEATPGEKNHLDDRERDRLMQETFAACFERGAMLLHAEEGTLCDPRFLVYIGMIATEKSDVLAYPALLTAPENAPTIDASDVPSSHDAIVGDMTMTVIAKEEDVMIAVPEEAPHIDDATVPEKDTMLQTKDGAVIQETSPAITESPLQTEAGTVYPHDTQEEQGKNAADVPAEGSDDLLPTHDVDSVADVPTQEGITEEPPVSPAQDTNDAESSTPTIAEDTPTSEEQDAAPTEEDVVHNDAQEKDKE